MKELALIQQSLVCPKTHYNAFAKYNYRNASDILDAFKNAAKEHKCSMVITDDVVLIGDKYFVKAVATITNADGESVSSSAFAELPNERKGMDASQVTGASSSYARKYALNGLLAIDDTLDNDDLAAQGDSSKESKRAKANASANTEKKTIKKEDKEYIEYCIDYCKKHNAKADILLKWYVLEDGVAELINSKL